MPLRFYSWCSTRGAHGNLAQKITYCQMDASHLAFADETFDAVVSRNLTWNLEDPEQAYKEWMRVLKKGGILLNYDANWYHHHL